MFGFDEDLALKEKLQGFQTINYATGQLGPPNGIPVYFRFPDAEIRDRTFPHIAIDLISIDFDPTRAMRANGYIQPIPTEQATPPSGDYLIADDMPLPWMLIYQLACYARLPRDDRFMQLMMIQLFPEQFGYLDMSGFDGTIRRADLVSSVRRDTVDQDQKRLYRNIHTISISTELYLNQLQYVQQISEVDITINFTGSQLVIPS